MLSVSYALSNRKALTIFDALKGMCSYYLQQGFQIVFIKGNGEFAPIEAWMATVYGTPKLNMASANKHVPEIERKIWVIKERVRATIYSIPFNSLSARMLVHAVLFVTKQLNQFPGKGGLSSKLSSKQIMWSTISSVQWILVSTARFIRRTNHAMVLYSRRKVQFCLDPVGTPKGAKSFSL
jgi:hypothetical protein